MEKLIQYMISAFVLVLAIPVGYVLRNYTKEELTLGRKYFFYLWTLSLFICALTSVVSIFIQIDSILRNTIIFGLIFIAIVSFISWKK